MVRLALKGEFVPYAVNVSGRSRVAETVRPFVQLSSKLGHCRRIAQGGVRRSSATYHGRIAERDTRVLTLAASRGSCRASVHEPVTFVNAPIIARERGS